MGGSVFINVSGIVHEVTAIHLYPENAVAEWQAVMAQARERLGGFSTGIGFFGSPEWVIGGALLLGALESKVSDAKAKDGVRLLAVAAGLREQVRRAGHAFSVDQIRDIDQPAPPAWRASRAGKKRVEMKSIPLLDRGSFLGRNGLSKSDVIDGSVMVDAPVDHIALPEEFISFETAAGPLSVRWASIASYAYSKVVGRRAA